MMSSSDAIIWNIERDPQLRSTVMSVWMLDKAPTPDRMATNLDRMVAAIPRLRQRVVDARPRPRWDPVEIDMADHYVTEHMPAGADWRSVLDYAETWVREPFAAGKPLWKFGLLTGVDGDKAAIVIKVHHAIADGMGMVLMLGAFTDLEPNPADQSVGPAIYETALHRDRYSPTRRMLTKAGNAARRVGDGPIAAATHTVQTLASAARLVTPHRKPLSPLMTQRSTALHMDTRSLPLELFRSAGEDTGASLNDTFVTVVADALVRYHAEHGVAADRLRMHIPVDARSDRTATLAGNQFVPARVSLDVADPNRHIRGRKIRDQLAALRTEPALGHVNSVSAALQRLGKPTARFIIGGMMKGVDVLASNVPGPPFPLYTAGAKIEQFYGFGPPTGAALNVTLFSYNDQVWLGMTSDAAAIKHRDSFLRCLDESIAAGLSEPATSPSH